MFLDRFLRGILVASAGAVLAAPVSAAEVLPGPYLGSVERVVDGDTLAVRVSVWLQQEIRVLVRVRGIDAPELRGECESEKRRAVAAQAELARLVANGPVVLRQIQGDKYYGRVVADVLSTGGADVALTLVAAGHARPYDGGGRASWCAVGSLDGAARAELARAERLD